MANIVARPGFRRRTTDTVSVWSHVSALPARVGDIGPIRKEIMFEPLPELPAAEERPVEAPARPVEEPVPAER